jgi:hypothetical protein
MEGDFLKGHVFFIGGGRRQKGYTRGRRRGEAFSLLAFSMLTRDNGDLSVG